MESGIDLKIRRGRVVDGTVWQDQRYSVDLRNPRPHPSTLEMLELKIKIKITLETNNVRSSKFELPIFSSASVDIMRRSVALEALSVTSQQTRQPRRYMFKSWPSPRPGG